MSGATIMAPMTVAVLSAMTPAVAMIVASTRSTQNLLAEGLRHERSMKSASVMRSMSSVVTVVGMGTPFSRPVIVPAAAVVAPGARRASTFLRSRCQPGDGSRGLSPDDRAAGVLAGKGYAEGRVRRYSGLRRVRMTVLVEPSPKALPGVGSASIVGLLRGSAGSFEDDDGGAVAVEQRDPLGVTGEVGAGGPHLGEAAHEPVVAGAGAGRVMMTGAPKRMPYWPLSVRSALAELHPSPVTTEPDSPTSWKSTESGRLGAEPSPSDTTFQVPSKAPIDSGGMRWSTSTMRSGSSRKTSWSRPERSSRPTVRAAYIAALWRPSVRAGGHSAWVVAEPREPRHRPRG